jgi:hypothetical protein
MKGLSLTAPSKHPCRTFSRRMLARMSASSKLMITKQPAG